MSVRTAPEGACSLRVVTTARRPSAVVLKACARFGLAVCTSPGRDAAHRARAARAALALDSLAPSGSLTLLLGPSGSGKSGALRALAGHLTRKGGAVIVAGPVSRRRSARTLVELLPGRLGDRLSVLGSAGLGEASLLARRVVELSDGERARACLALAMARAARIAARGGRCTLLIDEFTSGLDAETSVSLGVSLARWCARQNRGRVIAASSREELGAAVTNAAVIQTRDLYAPSGID